MHFDKDVLKKSLSRVFYRTTMHILATITIAIVLQTCTGSILFSKCFCKSKCMRQLLKKTTSLKDGMRKLNIFKVFAHEYSAK